MDSLAAPIRDALYKMAIAMATLWFWHRGSSESMKFIIRAKNLETSHNDLVGKIIVIEIRIEDGQ